MNVCSNFILVAMKSPQNGMISRSHCPIEKIGKIHAFDEAYLIVQILKCSLYAVDFEGGFSWSKVVVYRYAELIETIVYVSKKPFRKKLSNVIQ